MITAYRVQPSSYVDNVKNGVEFTKSPYPFFVNAEGVIGRQDFWKGKAVLVIGFVKSLTDEVIWLPWRDAVKDPACALKLYPVISDSLGDWRTYDLVIESITTVQVGEGFFPELLIEESDDDYYDEEDEEA